MIHIRFDDEHDPVCGRALRVLSEDRTLPLYQVAPDMEGLCRECIEVVDFPQPQSRHGTTGLLALQHAKKSVGRAVAPLEGAIIRSMDLERAAALNRNLGE